MPETPNAKVNVEAVIGESLQRALTGMKLFSLSIEVAVRAQKLLEEQGEYTREEFDEVMSDLKPGEVPADVREVALDEAAAHLACMFSIDKLSEGEL